MSDDERRRGGARIDVGDDDERRRALLHTARNRGGLCAGCGRALADDEPVWWAPFALRGVYGRRSYRWAPVARECAPHELVRETEAEGPEPCVACGRGVHYGSTSPARDVAYCSKRCRGRAAPAWAKEAWR